MRGLSGKVAIITGGCSGMGKSHLLRLMDEGCKVVFTDIDEEAGVRLEAELGADARFVKADVGEEEDWKRVVSNAVEEYHRIDILVNNAGIGGNKPIEDMSMDMYMKVLKVNQISVFLGMKYVIPYMKKQKSGSIINISSTNAYGGSLGGAAYNSTKYAVRGLSKTAAIECAPYGIRVNTIFPGLIETPLVTAPQYAEYYQEICQTIPALRAGNPEDISGAVAFLASDDSLYFNGAEIVIDGGFQSHNRAFSDYVYRRTGF